MNIKDYKKIDNFQPVAMKCTEEQFNEMKPILEMFGCQMNHCNTDKFRKYLCNNFTGEKNHLAIISKNESNRHNRTEIPYNQEAFLKACGIERIEHPEINLSKITPEIIRELNKEPNIHDILVKEGVVKPRIEFGSWVKNPNLKKWMVFYGDGYFYGFDISGRFFYRNDDYQLKPTDELATPTEVIERLKAEAVKRGYKKGVKFKSVKPNSNGETDIVFGNIDCNFYFKGFDMYNSCGWIFKDGIWAKVYTEPQTAYIQVPISEIDSLSSKKLGRFVKELASKY